MANAVFDVAGVGNAIVDVIAQSSEALISRLGLAKGTMTLIDAAAAERLYAEMGAGLESSGGSAANTIAGIASFGGKAAYIGKVRDDKLGRAFRQDIRAVGVEYRETPRDSGPPTARCLIFVTPDAQRTMQTFLGISVELGPGDIDEDLIGASQITYLEGYLFDREAAKEAFVRAAEVAHAAGRKVALTLSDPFCVERHRAAFQHLVAGHVDILFANELEIASLYQTRSFEDAVAAVRGHCEIAALTRGAKGSVLVTTSGTHQIAAEPVTRVVDTTGAGDLYAAGVLYGLTRGYEPAVCGRYGSLAAAEVIGHFGARPETSLAALARKKFG